MNLDAIFLQFDIFQLNDNIKLTSNDIIAGNGSVVVFSVNLISERTESYAKSGRDF